MLRMIGVTQMQTGASMAFNAHSIAYIGEHRPDSGIVGGSRFHFRNGNQVDVQQSIPEIKANMGVDGIRFAAVSTSEGPALLNPDAFERVYAERGQTVAWIEGRSDPLGMTLPPSQLLHDIRHQIGGSSQKAISHLAEADRGVSENVL